MPNGDIHTESESSTQELLGDDFATFLVSYFHKSGRGRIFIHSTRQWPCEDTIIAWEHVIYENNGCAEIGIMSFVKLAPKAGPFS